MSLAKSKSRRGGAYQLSDEERTAVRAGMDAARCGDFAPDAEMDEFYRLHHLWHRHSEARA
jgi:hypothetical protein